MTATPAPLSPYWQQVARELTAQFEPGRDFHWADDAPVWVGRALAVLAEALRVSGDTTGEDLITRRTIAAELAGIDPADMAGALANQAGIDEENARA